MDSMSITRCQGTLWIENSCPLWNATLLLCRRKICSIMQCILPTYSPLINLSSFLPFLLSLVSRISLSSDSYFCLVSWNARVQRRRPAYSDIFCCSFTQSCASNKFFSRSALLWVITQQVLVKTTTARWIITTARYVTTQKSAVFIYFAVKAHQQPVCTCQHAPLCFIFSRFSFISSGQIYTNYLLRLSWHHNKVLQIALNIMWKLTT